MDRAQAEKAAFQIIKDILEGGAIPTSKPRIKAKTRSGGKTPSMANDTDTQTKQNRDAVLSALAQLGSLTVGDDSLVFQGSKFVLPEQYADDIEGAVSFLENYDEQQNTTYEFSRTFDYRPFDGAAAFDRALRKVFNHSGIGKSTMTMFGKQPPEFRTVEVGVNDTIQVPWGQVSVAQLNANFMVGATRSREKGVVFELAVRAPRKFRAHLNAFFDVVAEELRTGSIYRGKAVNGASDPGFLDLTTVDPSQVIYSAEVSKHLGANLWTLIEHAPHWRELGVSLKRSVLLSGTYGTGKTLAGMLTAQRATAHGFTFILCRPGVDDLFETLTTAQLYAPAVVWFEDIDVLAEGGDADHISRLLDALDGISNKGVEVLAGFTTNHVKKIQRGLLRPGRIDAIIDMGTLDAKSVEKLVRSRVPSHLLSDDINWGTVHDAFKQYVPAFYVEAIERSMRYAMERTGHVDMVTTEDLRNAAEGLLPQFNLMNGAHEGPSVPTIDDVMGKIVTQRMTDEVSVDMSDGELVLRNSNGHA